MRPALVPCLRYVRAPEAIAFLCEAFGFARHLVYADADDPALIHHAQLTLNGCMIMLGSARDTPDAALYGWRTPAEAGGVTMSVCVVLADPDAHYAKAVAGGAAIITAPRDNQGYPGRAYSARDCEGNVWHFDSYDPSA